jgi:hypothetical protein
MVYHLLRDCFAPNDFANGFNFFFEICGHIIQGHVPPSISPSFSTSQLLMLEKLFRSIHPIAISEMIYRLIACTLIILFKDIFMEHFNLH